MIRSSIRKDTYLEIYRMLDRVSPLEFDCGRLCGAACCRDEAPEEEGPVELGMELLPGEEKVHDRNDGWLTWSEDEAEELDYPDSWHGKVYFVKCSGPENCCREKRPIQCRTFPLAPHFMPDGRLVMILNSSDELTYECPLTDPEMVPALGEQFVKVTCEAWGKLVSDPLIRDLVELDSEDRETVTVVYDPEGEYRPGQLVMMY